MNNHIKKVKTHKNTIKAIIKKLGKINNYFSNCPEISPLNPVVWWLGCWGRETNLQILCFFIDLLENRQQEDWCLVDFLCLKTAAITAHTRNSMAIKLYCSHFLLHLFPLLLLRLIRLQGEAAFDNSGSTRRDRKWICFISWESGYSRSPNKTSEEGRKVLRASSQRAKLWWKFNH